MTLYCPENRVEVLRSLVLALLPNYDPLLSIHNLDLDGTSLFICYFDFCLAVEEMRQNEHLELVGCSEVASVLSVLYLDSFDHFSINYKIMVRIDN